MKICSQEIKQKWKIENNYTKYEDTKLSGIPNDRNPAITMNEYKYKCLEYSTKHEIWDILYIPDPQNDPEVRNYSQIRLISYDIHQEVY